MNESQVAMTIEEAVALDTKKRTEGFVHYVLLPALAGEEAAGPLARAVVAEIFKQAGYWERGENENAGPLLDLAMISAEIGRRAGEELCVCATPGVSQ